MTIHKYVKDKNQKDIFDIDEEKRNNRNLKDVLKAIDANTNELLIMSPNIDIILQNQKKIFKMLEKLNRKKISL